VESSLQPLSEDDFESALGRSVFRVDDERDWERAAFRARQGPELWWSLLLAVLLLLLAEGLIASSGTGRISEPRARAEAEAG
jgi:hypothetical protein